MIRQANKKRKSKKSNSSDEKALLYWENTPEQEDDIPQDIRPYRNMLKYTGDRRHVQDVDLP